MARPPAKWVGGKYYLSKKIIPHFPEHKIYVEPFGGMGSVLLNKPPAEVEVFNDLDLRVTRFFRVLREQSDAFLKKVNLIPYSSVEFESANAYPAGASDLDMAICDFVRWRQSFGGQGKSWSYTKTRSRGGMAGDVNGWWTAIEGLPEVVERIKRVQILNWNAMDVIEKFDHEDALIYCDPPYLHSARATKDLYACEMSENDHRDLADFLNECRSKVVLSGYPSDLYNELYQGWRVVEFDIANHAAGGKKKKRETEVIWLNF